MCGCACSHRKNPVPLSEEGENRVFGLLLLIQAFYLAVIFFIDNPSFHLHGRGQFTAFDGKFIRQNDKFFNGLNSGKCFVNFIQLFLYISIEFFTFRR